MSREKSFNILRTAVAMLAAILVAFVIIILISDQPVKSILIFLLQPFSSKRYLGNIVETAIPLIFSGLSMAILFQTSLFNLGGEGVYFMAGIAGSIAANPWQIPVLSLNVQHLSEVTPIERIELKISQSIPYP